MKNIFRNTPFFIILMFALTLLFNSCDNISESTSSVSFGLDSNKLASKVADLYSETEEISSTEPQNTEYQEKIEMKVIAEVYYSYDDISKKEDFPLITVTGDEVTELNQKSKAETEAYYQEKFLNKTITINDLPIDKIVEFKMKIVSKVSMTFEVDGKTETSEHPGETLAISKAPVKATIGTDSTITIILTDYDESKDWDILHYTLSGTFGDDYTKTTTLENVLLNFWKKSDSTWERVGHSAQYLPLNKFKLTDKTFECTTSFPNEISVGDTIMATATVTGYTYSGLTKNYSFFVAWSEEFTVSTGINAINLGDSIKSYQDLFTPAPETLLIPTIYYPETIAIEGNSKTQYYTLELLTEDGKALKTFNSTIEFDNNDTNTYIKELNLGTLNLEVEAGTQITATISIYSDDKRKEKIYTAQELFPYYKNALLEPLLELEKTTPEEDDPTESGEVSKTISVFLYDKNEKPISTNGYYALLVTKEPIENTIPTNPLHLETAEFGDVSNGSNSDSFYISGDIAAEIIKAGTVYFTFAIFDTETDAESVSKTGSTDSAKYYAVNHPVTISDPSTSTFSFNILLEAGASSQSTTPQSTERISMTATSNDSGTVTKSYDTITKAIEAMTDELASYTITLNGVIQENVTISENVRVGSIIIEGLTGNGNNILKGSGSGSVLTISTQTPVAIRNLKISGGTGTTKNTDTSSSVTYGGGIYISEVADVTLADGAIIAGNSASKGGGIYNAGKLTMIYTAVIGDASMTSAATEDSYSNKGQGGGVYNDSGANMYLGTENLPLTGGIFYNLGGDGGGIYNEGNVIMSSGNVSYNSHTGYGAGIACGNGTFTISGGTVSYNKCLVSDSSYGGGFRIDGNSTSVIMAGGEISYNTAENGAGVSINSGATFKMSGGSIKDNEGTTGKSIYSQVSTVIINGITQEEDNEGVFENSENIVLQ